MKKVIAILMTLILIQGCKKTEACIQISNETPAFNEFIEISGDCSIKAKWYDFEIDGALVHSDTESSFEYAFTKKGNHLIKLTVYRKWNGSYNSRTGCTGCSGAGKSNSITKTITVN
jgi:hypothetical protein